MHTKVLLFNNKPTCTIFAVLVLAFVLHNGYGQTSTTSARNTVYADFASNGAVYSINYDRVFCEGKKINISFRAGISVLNDVIAFPLGIQFFTGQDASHIELSLTVEPYIEKYQNIFDGNSQSDKKGYIMPGVGYRYQKPGGGFFAKVVVGPIIYLDPPSDDFWNMDPWFTSELLQLQVLVSNMLLSSQTCIRGDMIRSDKQLTSSLPQFFAIDL